MKKVFSEIGVFHAGFKTPRFIFNPLYTTNEDKNKWNRADRVEKKVS